MYLPFGTYLLFYYLGVNAYTWYEMKTWKELNENNVSQNKPVEVINEEEIKSERNKVSLYCDAVLRSLVAEYFSHSANV